MHPGPRFFLALVLVACTAPTIAAADATIQSVVVAPTPPVPALTPVTVTTEFQTTNGLDGFTTDVTKTPGLVTIEICADVNFFAVIDGGTSVADLGTFPPGDVVCEVRLYDTQELPCGFLRDTASCDFVVTATSIPALPAWALVGLAGLVLGLARYSAIGNRRAG